MLILEVLLISLRLRICTQAALSSTELGCDIATQMATASNGQQIQRSCMLFPGGCKGEKESMAIPVSLYMMA